VRESGSELSWNQAIGTNLGRSASGSDIRPKARPTRGRPARERRSRAAERTPRTLRWSTGPSARRIAHESQPDPGLALAGALADEVNLDLRHLPQELVRKIWTKPADDA
jgi:hypothetical protein